MPLQKSIPHLVKSFANHSITNKLYFTVIALLVAFIAWQGFLLTQKTSSTTPVTGIARPNASDIIVGNPNARIKVILYTDYECPFCHTVDTAIPYWIQVFGSSTIAFHLRHLPLTYIHPKALEFARDVECTKRLYGDDAAYRIGTHLYENRNLSLDDIREGYSSVVQEVEEQTLATCRYTDAVTKKIESNAHEALINEVNRTPSMFIYDEETGRFLGKRVGGAAQPYDVILKTVIPNLKNEN